MKRIYLLLLLATYALNLFCQLDNVNINSVTIHRDNLLGGIYFIRIHSDDTYVKKVIIR